MNNFIKRFFAVVLSFMLVFPTLSIGFSYKAEGAELPPVSIAMEWRESKFKNETEFNIIENNPTSNTVKLKVSYHSDNVGEKGYKPGELIITVKGIGNVNRNGLIEALVGADKDGAGTNNRDWTYTWNKANDTYTLVNNREIKANSVLSGYFEMAWAVDARNSKNGYSQDDIQAQLIFPDGTSTSSQALSFTNTTKADTFVVYIKNQEMYSCEGLEKYFDNGSIDDYVFVRYNMASFEYRKSRGITGSYYIFNPDVNKTGSGAIVISPSLDCTDKEDGTYGLSPFYENYSQSYQYSRQYVFVAYPKESYGEKTVTASLARYGVYYEGDDSGNTGELELASAKIDAPIKKDFTFSDIPEELYKLQKDTYYDKYVSDSVIQTRGGDIVGSKMRNGTTETFYLEARLNNSHNEKYTWEIVDDFMYIAKNNGEFRQLKEGEYEFSVVTIPSASSIKNINNFSIAADKYEVSVFAGIGGTLVDTAGTPAWTGKIKDMSQNVTLPENTTGIAVVIYGIDESFQNMSFPVKVKFHIEDTSNLEWEEQDNLTGGQVVNTSFVKLYKGENNWINDDFTADNYNDDTNLNLAQKDLDTYGSYLDRERDNITFYPSEESDYRAITSLDSLKETGKKLSVGFTMGASFDFKQEQYPNHFSLYTILPKGFALEGYKVEEDIWDIMSLSGLGMKSEKLLDACTPEIITDYNGSGRTYIGLHFDFGDAQIVQNKEIRAKFKLKADKSYFKESSNVYARSCVVIDDNIDETPIGKTADDGTWGDNEELFSDIDHDDNTNEALAYSYASKNIIFVDSSQLLMSKYVRTTYSDGWTQLPNVPLEEYGGAYQYLLELTTGNNTATNIVVKDVLESETNSKWQGTLHSVDLSECEALGLSGIVYYSTKTNPNDELSSDDWSAAKPENGIKAVAIDFGSSQLQAGKTLSVIINMKAPNDTSLKGEVTENATYASFNLVDDETGNLSEYYKNQKSSMVQVKLSPKLKTLVVIKEDEEDGTRLSGACFDLVDKDTNDTFSTVQSNSKGYAVFNDVPVDGSFIIREIAPPTGYKVADEIEVDLNNSDVQYITVKDPRKTGTVELIKVNNLDRNMPVSGAEYTVFDSDNKVIKTDVTDEQGKIIFSELPWGKYTVKETGAPIGYQLNETEYSVEINRDTVMNTISIRTVDTQDDTFVHLVKYAMNIDGTQRDETLPGTTFELVRKSGSGEKHIGLYVTDKNGRIDVTDLPYGDYYFHEYRAPAGYELADNVEFTISPDKKDVSVNVYDKRKPGKVILSKRDNLGSIVRGVQFTLYDETKETALGEYTTDQYGTISIDNLEWGTYYLKETYTPEYYQNDPEFKEVEIDGEHLEVLVYCVNETQKGSVVLTKTDEIGNNKLAGAEYNLYTVDGDMLGSYTTDENGEISISDLEWGSYYFKETKAPEGYGLSDETVRFSVNTLTAGRTQYLNVTDPRDAKTITLTKVIKADDINFDNGDPTFMFKVSGKDINDEEHTYYRMLTFTESYVRANTDSSGYVSNTVTVSGLTAGIYTASEEDSSRYVLDDIYDIENGQIVEGNMVELDVSKENTAAATFLNVRYENQFFSDNQSVTNVIKKGAQLTAIRADYSDTDVEAGSSVNKGKLTVTALYDDGTSKIVDGDAYELSIESFPISGGYYTVDVSYTEGSITRTDSFTVKISVNNIRKIISLEAVLKDPSKEAVIKSELSADMFNVSAIYSDNTRDKLTVDRYRQEFKILPKTAPDVPGQFTITVSLNTDAIPNDGESVSTTVDMMAKYPVMNYFPSIPRDAKALIFTDATAPAGAKLTQCCVPFDNSVVSWSDGTTAYVSTQIKGVKVFAPENCRGLLSGLSKIELIDCTFLDTSQVTNMERMFQNVGISAEKICITGLSGWNTSNVTNMNSMFSSVGSNGAGTVSITGLSKWDTSNVTDMSRMFYSVGYFKATTVSIDDLSEWDISSVTNMSEMFSGCGRYLVYNETQHLPLMDLSGWNVEKVTAYDNFSYKNVIIPPDFGSTSSG